MNADSAVTREPAQREGAAGDSPKAPPRAETVGSLLRDDAVVRAARRSSPADNALLGDAVRDAIRLQEELGLDVITDGEVRRVSWAQTPRFVDAFSIAGGQPPLDWRGATEGRFGASATGAEIRRGTGYPAVVRRVATARRTGDMAAEYAFLARFAATRTKFTLPAPSYHRRYWAPEGVPGRGLRLARGVPDRDPRLPPLGGAPPDRPRLRLPAARRAQLRLAVRSGHRRRDARRRARPGGGAGVRRRPRPLPVRRADRGHLGRARLPGQRPGRRLALRGRLRLDLGPAVPPAGVDRLLLEYDSDRAGGFEPLADVPRRDGRGARPAHHQVAPAGVRRRHPGPDQGGRPLPARWASWPCPPSAGSPRCRSPAR